ncbi:MAG: hypothetical protein GYA21_05300 [Myxococcales bacterium]|nr:hypothetical protein [Myxococcales bacterium]
MRSITIGLLGLLAAHALAQTAPPPPQKDWKIVVPGIIAYPGIPSGTAEVLNDLLLEAMLSRHGIRAVGPSDVRSLLAAEQQAQLLGCSDEGCMTRLAGILGADFLVGGTIGKLDNLFVLNLQIIDAREGKVTSRASESFSSLAEAPARVGPLTDRLLNAQPRYRASTAAFARALPTKAMETGEFCKRMQEYLDGASRAPYAGALVELRRTLLSDLVATQYQMVFDQKRSCFWSSHGRTQGLLRLQRYRAGDDEAAFDVWRRAKEFDAMAESLTLLAEAYPRGLEMEKNGTGRRLEELPFAVREEVPERPEQIPGYAPYRQAYLEALPLLKQALSLVERDDSKAFAALFSHADPRRANRDPPSIMENLRHTRKTGFALEPCPPLAMGWSDLASAIERFQKTKELGLCYRKVRSDYVSIERILFVHDGKAWRLLGT